MPRPVPPPVAARDIAPDERPSQYPAPFQDRVAGRIKRRLGDHFGLRNFGVNLTTLLPGAASALRHAHSRQDELVFVLEGRPTLYTNDGPVTLAPGMCAGMPAGSGEATCLVNETDEPVVYLEIGDRTAGDAVGYPDDDLAAKFENGRWVFTRKDGTPY